MRAVLPVAVCVALFSGQALATPRPAYVGTTEPFASDAVYFVVTDRFVNGDPSNDHRDQGGKHRTFDIPVRRPDPVAHGKRPVHIYHQAAEEICQ